MATRPPLNTDLREWALQEIARLEAENAALKEELANRPGPPGGGGPPGQLPPDWERPPAIPSSYEESVKSTDESQ